MQRHRRFGLFVSTVGLSGLGFLACGGSAYLTAAGTFASAAASSTPTMQSAVDFNHALCAQRAQLAFLQHRLEGTNTTDGLKAMYADDSRLVSWGDWSSRYAPQLPDGGAGPTWTTVCSSMQASDAIVTQLLAALSAYASALKTVASADYSGADIGGLVTNIEGAVAAIPGAPTPATGALKALGSSGGQPGPIGQLGGVIKQAYAAGKVKEIVKEADPSVTKILEAIQTYLGAVGLEETQWENDGSQMLDSLGRKGLVLPVVAAPTPATPPPTTANASPPGDSVSKAPAHPVKSAKGKGAEEAPVPTQAPAPPASIAPPRPALDTNAAEQVVFFEFARRWSRTVEATQTKQKAMVDAVQKLEAAQKALVKADGANDAPDLVTVLGTVTQVLSDIAAVQSAIQKGAAQ
jgi:hypothetical protein